MKYIVTPNIYVTSDTHFGHRNIIEYENRPFKDVEDMNEKLIENWNKVVKPHDLVVHVGDLFLCGAKKAEEIAKRLNGRKILVKGNHDSFSKAKYDKMGFDLRNYLYLDDYLFSHYPLNPEMLRIAQLETDLYANIHGHVHGMTQGLDREVHICVCTEHTDYTPIPFWELKDLHNSDTYLERGEYKYAY
ncbi:metallophosphoesterase [Bacillus phage Anthos]|uniref:Metallophosphoesterase n=1 Tax=Bacillus phage Anthos TaxID=2796502 RepID=A0A7U3T8P1_9CAUD|nr:metallophosphoesterase [Bacillus phage Anthos]